MGYDVSFHPISPEEMREWYFTPLTWIQQGQEEKVLALAAQYGMEDFYAEKYLNTLRVGAETESNELFDKSVSWRTPATQGRTATQVFWTRRHFNASKAASRRKQRNRHQKRNARFSSCRIAYTVAPAAPRCTEWVARTTGKTRCT